MKPAKYNIYALRVAGFFFYLASAEGAGLLFCPAAIQRAGLYRGFSCDLTYSTAHDTRPTQADIIPPATRWRAYTRPDGLHRYQIPTPRRTLYKSAQPPIIIRYIGGAAVQHTADHASPAGSAPTVCGSLASATPGVSTEGSTSPPVQGQPGGAEPLAALAASLFGLSPDS